MHAESSGKPCKSGHLWSAEDDAVLRLLHRLRRTSADLAVILHRTDYAVRLRLRHLGEVPSADDTAAFNGAGADGGATAAAAAHDETLSVMGTALWRSVQERMRLQSRCDALDDEAALYEGRIDGLERELDDARTALASARAETRREVERRRAAEAAAAAGAASAAEAATAAAGEEAEGLRRKLEEAKVRLRLLRRDAEATARRRREALERHRGRESIVTERDEEVPAQPAAPPPLSFGVSAPEAPLPPATAAEAAETPAVSPPPFSIGTTRRGGARPFVKMRGWVRPKDRR